MLNLTDKLLDNKNVLNQKSFGLVKTYINDSINEIEYILKHLPTDSGTAIMLNTIKNSLCESKHSIDDAYNLVK